MSSLVIPDATPAELRVVASGLELHNRNVVEESMRRNRANVASRKAASKAHLRGVVEEGADFIKRASSTTRSYHL